MYRWYNEDKERCEETVEVLTVGQALALLTRFVWEDVFQQKEK